MRLIELVQLKLNSGSDKGGCFTECGLTLLEVIFSLVISGILLITSMRFLTDQWQGARTLKNHLEAHYFVMTAGETVSAAIRRAETVVWVKDSEELRVLPMPEDANPVPTLDSYFIDDLDRDRTKDLYWKHSGIAQPLASYISKWECMEVEPGLWKVFLQSSVDDQVVSWRSVIRQRTSASEFPVSTGLEGMSAFLSSSF